MRSLLALLFAVTLTSALVAAPRTVCGPNGCFTVGGQSLIAQVGQAPAQNYYEWRASKFPQQLDLFLGGRQIGAWNQSEQYFRFYDSVSRTWGLSTPEPPYPLAFSNLTRKVTPAEAKAPAVENFGLDLGAMKDEHTPFDINGKAATKEEVMEALTAGVIPDDRGKLRFSVFGSKEKCATVLNDLKRPENKDIADKVVTWQARPDHWSLQDSESGKPVFVAQADPTIYLQGPDGKALARLDGYSGPPDFEAIRKVTKGYDPAKDWDPRKVGPALPDFDALWHEYEPIILLAAGGLAVYFFTRNKP